MLSSRQLKKMLSSRQIKGAIRSYKRAFKHNWGIFKHSRIGMIGLTIMLTFVLIAIISPLIGLRDPLYWMAPDEDILDIENYYDVAVDGVVTTNIVVRQIPILKGSEKPADRLYFAGGDIGKIAPYGLYAKETGEARQVWGSHLVGAFETYSPITTQPIGVNFGSKTETTEIDFRLFFGCQDGTLYILKDEYGSYFVPSGTNVWTANLDGPVSGVAVYEETMKPSNNVLDGKDLYFASTEAGSLYAYNGTFDLIWSKTGNETISNYSLTQPTISSDGEFVYVGSRDGKLYGFDAASGFSIGAEYDLYDPLFDYIAEHPYIEEKIAANQRRGYWSSYPIAMGDKVFAATDDGRVHNINAENATAIQGWEGGYKVDKTAADLDLGNLTSPDIFPDGSIILVSSSTGNFYILDAFVTGDNLSAEGCVRAVFDTSIGGALEVTCVAPPYYDWQYQKYIYVPVQNQNGTPGDPTDDSTILYSLGTDASVTWRMSFDGVIYGKPVVFNDYGDDHISPSEIVLATVMLDESGEPVSGPKARLYSYSTGGSVLAPLPPSWTISEDDKYWTGAGDEPHASGNTYVLGTDSEGRDVLSQVLLGSRIALLVGFSAATFSISIGMLVGLVSGYYGGNVDAVLMRFTDVIIVLPGLPLLIILAALLNPSIWNIVLAISMIGWGGTARIIRSEVLTLKERPFIDSARVTGASKARIMFKHIAPNVMPLALLYMTFFVGGAILSEAALAFIGLGDPGTMSWGMMLNLVQHSNALNAWWWLIPPGISISLVCMSFYLVGRAFDEVVNPRLRKR